MVKVAPFEVEIWMDKYQPTAKYDMAETCAASISVDELLNISENKAKSTDVLSQSQLKLTYGDIRGSDSLRNNLANLYSARRSGITKDDILITNGAIAANHLVFYSLINAGDHVICQYPIYEQLYRVPSSFGAEVSLWKANAANKWQLDVEDLKAMLKSHTKMIVLNNPNNPTGQIVSKPKLDEIIEIARQRDIIVLCDEVYRPMFHSIGPSDDEFPPSAINLGYDRVIVTGSLSKAYSLAGIRVGWIACRAKDIIEECAMIRHYTTISVSRLDEAVAAEALSERCVHGLLARNIALARTNLAFLEAFVDEHKWSCSWVKPRAGTTAMIKFAKMGKPVDDEIFCTKVFEKTGVMLCPAARCFGGGTEYTGHVRVGFVCETQVLKAGLAALRTFMEDEFDEIPVIKRDKEQLS